MKHLALVDLLVFRRKLDKMDKRGMEESRDNQACDQVDIGTSAQEREYKVDL